MKRTNRRLFAFLAALALVLNCGCGYFNEELRSQRRFDRAVLWQLPQHGHDRRIGELTIQDYEAIRQLILIDSSRFSLSPIEKLVHLRYADLENCRHVTDLTPVTNLVELEHLDLANGVRLTDLAPLKNLVRMKQLYLDGCEGITDLTPLQNMNQMEILKLGQTSVNDLTPLKGMKKLKWLYFDRMPALSDLSPLEELTGLECLYLSECKKVTDVTPLKNLPRLNRLFLRGTSVVDLTPLASIKGLALQRPDGSY